MTCWWHTNVMLMTNWWHFDDILMTCWWHIDDISVKQWRHVNDTLAVRCDVATSLAARCRTSAVLPYNRVFCLTCREEESRVQREGEQLPGKCICNPSPRTVGWMPYQGEKMSFPVLMALLKRQLYTQYWLSCVAMTAQLIHLMVMYHRVWLLLRHVSWYAVVTLYP